MMHGSMYSSLMFRVTDEHAVCRLLGSGRYESENMSRLLLIFFGVLFVKSGMNVFSLGKCSGEGDIVSQMGSMLSVSSCGICLFITGDHPFGCEMSAQIASIG